MKTPSVKDEVDEDSIKWTGSQNSTDEKGTGIRGLEYTDEQG